MLIYILTLLAITLAWLIRKQYTYWQRTNIPYVPPVIPFGVLKDIFGKRSFGLIISDIYNASQEKILGIYLFFKPVLLVRDAEVARQIMTGDFGSFHDRGLYVDEEHDPLSGNLFVSRGSSWRSMRTKLTPSFTSGKLKGMFVTIDEVGEKMVQYLNKELEGHKDGKLFEMKDIMTTYAVDIIGSVIFGLDVDSFSNPQNEFRQIHVQVLKGDSVVENILNVSSIIYPPLTKVIKRLGFQQPAILKMRNIMERTINYREDHKVVRRDLLQLLIQLRNTGKISEDDDKVWQYETAAENLKSMSIEALTANAFVFYLAGTETTAASASFTVYELSMYPDLLKKAQTEVLEVLEKHGLKPTDKFTYDALQDMKFLELCLMETTRKYPGLPFLNRECTQDYQVPGTKHVIKSGTPILISLFGLHRDPEYFPDPTAYNPERYLEESKAYNPVAYMPFGEGPRHCIAQRMGKINSKLAVAKVLANFNVQTKERKEVEFIFTAAPVLIPKDGINVRLSKRV